MRPSNTIRVFESTLPHMTSILIKLIIIPSFQCNRSFHIPKVMPVQTRSATHAPSMASSEKPSAPRKQKRTKKSENENTAAKAQKTEPEVGEKRELPERDIREETKPPEVKKPKTESVDTNKCAFTPGIWCSPPSFLRR